MTPSNRKVFVEAGKLKDIIFLFIALRLAYSLGNISSTHLFLSRDLDHPIRSFALTLGLGIAWHASLSSVGLYWSHRLVAFYKEVTEIVQGGLLCAVFAFLWLIFICANPVHEMSACLIVSVLFALFAIAMLVIVRGFVRLIAFVLRKSGHNLRHVIIIGTNRRAIAFAESLEVRDGWGYHLHGFVDEVWCGDEESASYKHRLLGGFDQLPEFLRGMSIDEVIVALPMASFYNQIADVINLCRQHGILVRFAGNLFDPSEARRGSVSQISFDTITLHDESWNAWAYLVKRIVDLSLAFILVVLCSPAICVIALLIKLTSPGPIFFLQTRLGLNKRSFRIYKFRTMVVDAEKAMEQVIHLNETQGPTFKLKNDPRITKIGSLLRKTSLDEIPQLFNVIRGDMSLVGPRPLPLRDYDGFSEDWHRRRFSVKPGITCLWQVMGRSLITFEEWMALDMQYIDHWSVWLDVKILAQTIPAVLRGSGAA